MEKLLKVRDAQQEKAYLSALISILIDGLIIISGADDFESKRQGTFKATEHELKDYRENLSED